MKVLHIIGGGDIGGAKTHVFSLIQKLQEKATVTLVSLREGPFSQEAAACGIHTVVLPRSNPFSIWRTIDKMMKEEGYDLVHCHGGKANVVGAFLRLFCKRLVITTIHSDYRLDYLGNPIKQYTNGLLNTVALRCLSGYVAVTDAMQCTLVERGFDPYKIRNIYNGIDYTAQPEIKLDRASFFEQLGFVVQPHHVVMGIAGRLTKVKDMDTLIRAFAKAYVRDENLRLCIAGTGEDEQSLKKLAKSLGMEDVICFAGWVSDMDSFFAAIDINLLTSISETFPYVISFAVRAHVPCICSAVGGDRKSVV